MSTPDEEPEGLEVPVAQKAESAAAEEAAADEEVPASFPVISADEFRKVDFEAPIKESRFSDGHSLATIYRKAEADAQASGNEQERRVYALLSAICMIHFTPHDKARPWGPMWEGGNRRSAIPGDFVGDQTVALADVVASIKNPVLRSRIADITWVNNRRQGKIALLAVDAYCECVEKLLNGELTSEHGGDARATFEAVEYLERGLQVAFAVSKKGAIPQHVKETFQRLYQEAAQEAEFVAFCRAAELGLYYDVIDDNQVAVDAEALAARATDQYPIAVKRVWDRAARLYGHLEKEDEKRRCQLQ